MSRRIRAILVTIFTLYFLVVGSIIALKINGYNISFKDGFEIRNSVSISLDTYPKKAGIYLNDSIVGKTNKEISLNDGQDFNIKLSKPGFLDQTYTFSASQEQNSFFKLDKNLLVPTTSREIKFNEKYQNFKILQFLDEDKILAQDNINNSFYIFNFYQTSQNLDSPFTVSNSEKITNLESFKKIQDSVFTSDKQVIYWQEKQKIWSLKSIPTHRKIIKFNDNYLLYLDEYKNIWRLSLEINEPAILVDTNVENITSYEQNSWYLKGGKIFNLNQNNLAFLNGSEVTNFQRSVFCDDFQIKNIGKNLILKCDKDLYFLEENNIIYLGHVHTFNVFNDRVMWQDEEKAVFEFNSATHQKNFINFINVGLADQINFNQEYNSLFFKVGNSIYGIKYHDYWQNGILKNVSSNLWQEHKNCIIEQNSRPIFCLNQNTLEIYENNEVLF